jgi:succinate dehydrogenase / fumarate reductase iron-sulfur subunit
MSEVVLRIFRGGPEGGTEQSFTVPTQEGMVVLDAVHYVQQNYDSTIACRWNCKAAKCGSCSAEVNGMPRLMCKSLISELRTREITIYPMRSFPVIKDLVTDVSHNYEVAQQMIPFTPPSGLNAPFTFQQMDADRAQEFRKCIECFLCQNVCHVLREHNLHQEYFGPRFMVKMAALEMHPIDVANRVSQLRRQGGIGYCNITKCCQEVCPEHIRITDNSIIPLKERVVDEYFDPLLNIIRLITGRKS